MRSRYLSSPVYRELKEKMVFLGGPRQVGKTTLALQYLTPSLKENPAYLNWDFAKSKTAILKDQVPTDQKLIIFDEIHKYKHWRTLLKGYYDQYFPKIKFLVTGSARLDYYRKGGDSLLGRYFYYRLHPYSLCEINKNPSKTDLLSLLKFGGFPEPFEKQSENFHRKWQKARLARVIKEDLQDLENVKEISLIDLLVEILPERVGSPLSIKSLREDLHVAHETVAHWIGILENLYVCFRIAPFGHSKIRAVKKEQKLYFWDWTQIHDPGIRFENFVASQLLKYCHFHEDTEGHAMELRYIRDIDKREIDFVVLKNKKPLFAVECKSGEKVLSPRIEYFKQRTEIQKFYQVHLGDKDFGHAEVNGRLLPFTKFCLEEKML